jgi:hypothetical protein
MKRCKELKSNQVAATWSKLGKAVKQNSRNNGEESQQRFWIENKAALQVLVDQTIQSADKFNRRSTATVTHSLEKILHLTNIKSLSPGRLL